MRSKQLRVLLEKYHEGVLTAEEQALLDDWFDDLGKNEMESKLSELDKADLKNILLEFIKKKRSRPIRLLEPGDETESLPSYSYFRTAFRAAAAILLLAALSYVLWQFSPLGERLSMDRQITSASVSGKINKVVLADGSIVWLKNNSSLIYPTRFSGSDRRVTLQGEALFEVTKDREHPFIIQCGDLTTTVLGTSFNIRANDKAIEVVVLTGKVFLTSASDKKGIVIVPEEKAVYTKELKRLVKGKAEKEEAAATVSGTEYDMNFNDTRMDEIIRRVEGKFNVEVSVADPNLGNCVITADFTDQSLEKTLDIITTALAVEYEMDGTDVTLTGKGCH